MEPGQDPSKGEPWVAAWARKSCTCCQHLRYAHWPAKRCQPLCIRARFPIRVVAEWELAQLTHERKDTVIATPQGTTVHSSWRFAIADFVAYAEKVIRLPVGRWEPLIARLQFMHVWWQRHREGKFSFDAKLFAELQEIGVPIDQYAELVAADAGQEDAV